MKKKSFFFWQSIQWDCEINLEENTAVAVSFESSYQYFLMYCIIFFKLD